MRQQAAEAVAPSTVRDEVVRQHQALRALLQHSLARTRGSARRDDGGAHDLAGLGREIRRRFRAHLAFEEHVLVPVLSSADLWGPQRVRNLTDEHRRQRQQLDTLLEGIAHGWNREQLALALRALATDLLRDMEEEERDYLGPELLHDDPIVVDQISD
jgi:hypothetical protein